MRKQQRVLVRKTGSERQTERRADRQKTQVLLDLTLTCENIDLFPELQDLEVSLARLGGRHTNLGRRLGLGNPSLGLGSPSLSGGNLSLRFPLGLGKAGLSVGLTRLRHCHLSLRFRLDIRPGIPLQRYGPFGWTPVSVQGDTLTWKQVVP